MMRSLRVTSELDAKRGVTALAAVLFAFLFLSYPSFLGSSGLSLAAKRQQAASPASEQPSASNREAFIKKETMTRAARAGLFLAVGLVHLLLFAFYPRERTSLLFSLFAIGLSLIVFLTLLLAVN